MYEHIRGTLSYICPEYFVIDTNGIGYKIFIPVNLYTQNIQLSQEICLFVSFVVREDSMKLFGFQTKDDRNFFEKLCAVSGIGTKTALSLIGHVESSNLKLAIQTGNTLLLNKIPGIGKKTAERIIYELGDKIHKLKLDSKTTSNENFSHIASDALTALINLGYNHTQAQKALQKALDASPKELPLPKLITRALSLV